MKASDLITATCEAHGCGGILIYDPERSAWRHSDYRRGIDHAPVVSERGRPESTGAGRDTTASPTAVRAPISESEARLMDGNR